MYTDNFLLALQLPKIEGQLRELVGACEANTGNTFTVDGKPLLQLMTDEWETRKAVRIHFRIFKI